MRTRAVYDCAKFLVTTEFDVMRLALIRSLGAEPTRESVNRHYAAWLARKGKEPPWLTDFCIDVLTKRVVVDKKHLKYWRYRPLKGGL